MSSDRIIFLESEIKRNKELYYNGHAEISDHAYDELENELRQLDPNNYVLHLVGSMITNGNKIAHDRKMLSLEKTYSIGKLLEWVEDREVVSTLKIDGMSCSLIYEDGRLITAKTRGDGKFGENILSKVRWIDSIPKKIDINSKCEIRGEIFCREEQFYKLAKAMEESGLDKPSSQRNIVAGLIGRKDHVNLCGHLSFIAFDLIEEELKLERETQKYSLLKKVGFENPIFKSHVSQNTIQGTLDFAQEFMTEGEYLIDGIVFSYNDLSLNEKLGETAHHPKYKMAFKFQGQSKETIIENIEWSISRNGYLTPVANVEPVELSGAMISRVTLHNFGMVKQNNLKAGDKIEIVRSGEVIPKFLAVKESASGEFDYPMECSICASSTAIEDIRLICTNESCEGVLQESILNFIQKIGIDDLSTKRLEEMIKTGLVKSIADLYRLTVEDMLTLPKTKEKLAGKIISSIEKSKAIDLINFLAALGISGGAFNKCEKVVHAGFDSLKKVLNMGIEDLSEVELFAEKSSTEFVNSLNSKKELIEELISLGFNPTAEKVERGESLAGMKFCITGSLSRRRSEIAKEIKLNGGSVMSSVSKATSYLVTNDVESSSSKFKKAKELEIPILSEEKLAELIEQK